MPTLTVDGRDVFVLGGPGPADAVPLVCLHGAGGSAAMWPQLHVSFRAERGVYAVDLPGHGRSAPLPGAISLPAYAASVLAMLDAAGVARALLVGHSMGGAVAQLVALEAPGRVAGLLLLGTAARLRVAPEILALAARDFPAAVELVCRMAYGPAAPPDMVARGIAEMRKVAPAVLEGDFRACDGFDIRGRVAAIRAPTLVMVGEADVMTPPRFAAELAGLVPGAAFRTVPGTGHMLPVERAAVVAAELRGLLSRLPGFSLDPRPDPGV